IDIAIEDKDLTVTEQPDGSYNAKIVIYNRGSHSFPKFGVYFYAGDPDKGGRLLATHGAGPIMPGDGWGEYNPGLRLKSGENTISVVVDPDNKVAELNETNNKASKIIPGRQSKKPETSEEPKEGRLRHFVRLVVGDGKMTFQGQEVTWEELPSLLEKVADRHQTVFQIATHSEKDFSFDQEKNTTSFSVEFDEIKDRAGQLCSSFGFEYLSFVGVHPLGTKGDPSHFVSDKK
ncbi:MAG: hypothetical protein JXM79_10620, partial [Sedimentisphaerales bacterium]|nr:hypothetical protein [Sedimentisphaerales bacterium]